MFIFWTIVASLIVAALGITPLLVRKFIKSAIITGITFVVINVIFFYVMTFAAIGPMLGWYSMTVFIEMLCAVAVISALGGSYNYFDEFIIPVNWLAPGIMAIVAVLVFIGGSSFFQSSSYAALMPPMETRSWSQDIQPKDPKQMRMSSKENAIQRTKNAIGQLGTVGSQFEISHECTTLQVINGKLQWVLPLDFSGFGAWYSKGKIPGYAMYDALDPTSDPVMVKLDEGNQMVYSRNAFFGKNLERHLRDNGYLDKGLMDWTFEIDDQNNPWWVVTVYHLEIWGNAPVIDGIVTVHPVSGAITFIPKGEAPDWVDRVITDDVVQSYLTWQGTYSGGFWNAWLWGQDLTEAEAPKMIYSSEGQPEWVTNLTSTNGQDNSLIGLVYTNSRTGKSIRYNLNKGGSTDEAILSHVNENQDIKYKNLKGSDPQIYNSYGHMVAVVPLLNANHLYQEVAFVDVINPQIIAVGENQHQAMVAYRNKLTASGRQVAIDNTSEVKKITGVVDRIGKDMGEGGTVFYIYLKNVPHLFSIGANGNPALQATIKGDSVELEYYASEEDVMPLIRFNNLSLPLTKTANQVAVQNLEDQKTDQKLQNPKN